MGRVARTNRANMVSCQVNNARMVILLVILVVLVFVLAAMLMSKAGI